MSEWDDLIQTYENSIAWHGRIHARFTENVHRIDWMRQHREYCADGRGWGDDAFQYMWYLICKEMPDVFKFLEIGVYQGQITSFIHLCANKIGKSAAVAGVTIEPRPDLIDETHKHFGVPMCYLHYGTRSQNIAPLKWTLEFGQFDVVYIDGAHGYDDAAYDIALYGVQLKIGGILVMDDAGWGLNLPDGIYRGHKEVWMATRDILDNGPHYKHLFAVGHNRIYRKVAE